MISMSVGGVVDGGRRKGESERESVYEFRRAFWGSETHSRRRSSATNP
jgi:hypothetical protein